MFEKVKELFINYIFFKITGFDNSQTHPFSKDVPLNLQLSKIMENDLNQKFENMTSKINESNQKLDEIAADLNSYHSTFSFTNFLKYSIAAIVVVSLVYAMIIIVRGDTSIVINSVRGDLNQIGEGLNAQHNHVIENIEGLGHQNRRDLTEMYELISDGVTQANLRSHNSIINEFRAGAENIGNSLSADIKNNFKSGLETLALDNAKRFSFIDKKISVNQNELLDSINAISQIQEDHSAVLERILSTLAGLSAAVESLRSNHSNFTHDSQDDSSDSETFYDGPEDPDFESMRQGFLQDDIHRVKDAIADNFGLNPYISATSSTDELHSHEIVEIPETIGESIPLPIFNLNSASEFIETAAEVVQSVAEVASSTPELVVPVAASAAIAENIPQIVSSFSNINLESEEINQISPQNPQISQLRQGNSPPVNSIQNSPQNYSILNIFSYTFSWIRPVVITLLPYAIDMYFRGPRYNNFNQPRYIDYPIIRPANNADGPFINTLRLIRDSWQKSISNSS